MSTRYVYIVKGTEINIVGVWSSRDEAIQEAIHHAQDQGVKEYEINDISDEHVVIKPIDYETFEQVHVLRYGIQ